MRTRDPSLITCSISGYGDSGPYKSRKAYDLLIEAESGLCRITGEPSEPARVGIFIVDIAIGAAAQAAILEALIGRGRTGLGTNIRISMFEVMTDWLAVPYLHSVVGITPQRIGRAHPSISPKGFFTTSDDQQLLISIQNDRGWEMFATQMLNRFDMITDPEFSTNKACVINSARVEHIVAQVVGSRTNVEMEEVLVAGVFAFAGVKTMDGLIAHPHLVTSTITTAAGTDITLPAAPVLFDDERSMTASRMPA